jgi:anti-repressor protein
MEELVKIHGGEFPVDARELHEFLKVGKRYTTWIIGRLEKYEFQEGIDFLPKRGESSGGRPTTEYYLTYDVAKELSMVENNTQGRAARKYFIAREKQAIELERMLERQEIERQEALQKAKMQYPSLTEAIKEAHESPKGYHYSNEADLINRIVLGMTAKKFRDENEIKDSDPLRPNLSLDQIRAIEKLQAYSEILIKLDHDFQTRKKMLQEYYDTINKPKSLDQPSMKGEAQ